MNDTQNTAMTWAASHQGEIAKVAYAAGSLAKTVGEGCVTVFGRGWEKMKDKINEQLQDKEKIALVKRHAANVTMVAAVVLLVAVTAFFAWEFLVAGFVIGIAIHFLDAKLDGKISAYVAKLVEKFKGFFFKPIDEKMGADDVKKEVISRVRKVALFAIGTFLLCWLFPVAGMVAAMSTGMAVGKLISQRYVEARKEQELARTVKAAMTVQRALMKFKAKKELKRRKEAIANDSEAQKTLLQKISRLVTIKS